MASARLTHGGFYGHFEGRKNSPPWLASGRPASGDRWRSRGLWSNSDASVCYARVFDRRDTAMSKLKDIDGLFNGRHFDREVIVLCVRWYLRYKPSLRDLVEMMAERGLVLAHTTIMRW
jgi:hypothetical protein